MVFAKKEKIKEEKKGKCYRSASHMMFSSGIFGFQKNITKQEVKLEK